MADTETKAAPTKAAPTKAAKAAPDAHVPDSADPAAVRLAKAVEASQRSDLLAQFDKLRDRIGDDPETMPLPALRAMVGALEAAVARMGGRRAGFVSAGIAADLEARGYSVDPANGDVYLRDADTDVVTRIQRGTGVEERVEMPVPLDRTDGARQSVKAEV